MSSLQPADGSENQQSDVSLLRTAAGLDALFLAFPGLYFHLDPEGTIVDFRASNPGELYVPPAEFMGQRMVDVLPEAAATQLAEGLARAHGEGAPTTLEYTLPIDGREETFSARLVPAPGAHTIVAVLCITEARATEVALRLAEARYRSIVENAVEGIFQTSEDGRYLSANSALARIYGYDSPEELIAALTNIGTQLYVDPTRRAEFARRLREQDTVTQFESQVYRKDGSIIWISESARSARDEAGRVLYYEGVVEDITQRRQAEDALREVNRRLGETLGELQAAQQQAIQQERVRLVGQMASGIAHDFNNLLSVILGYTELLGSYVEPEGPASEFVGAIRRAADRAAALTRRILAAGRKQVLSSQVLDLNAVVANVYPMLRRVIRADIELVTELSVEPLCVLADPVQLEQALINLVMNARDALPEGGRICIATRLWEGRVPVGATPGPWVTLQVEDNGCGMDAETRARVFEPFFTTKPPGQGTGLGLSGVNGTAQQSGGFVELQSEMGAGTIVSVVLPRSTQPASPDGPDLRQAPLRPGAGTVLVAEDETMLRELVAGALRGVGYEVIEAANGAEALRLCPDLPGGIELLLTDLVMPELGGRELASQLVEQDPKLPVLFISGYSDDVEQVRNSPFRSGFLQKPFDLSVLVQKVRELQKPAV